MTIGLVATQTGLRASAIRYYEAQGLLPAPARQGGKRVYDATVFAQIAVIQMAKTAGFGLSEIRSVLAAVRGCRPQTAWQGAAKTKRAEIERELDVLRLRRRIVAALGRCSCASVQDCGRAFANALAKYNATTQTTSRRRRAVGRRRRER